MQLSSSSSLSSSLSARIHPDNASPGKNKWVKSRRVSVALALSLLVMVVSGRSRAVMNSDPGKEADVDASHRHAQEHPTTCRCRL